MAIERWDPLGDMVSLRDAMNTLFQQSVLRPGTLSSGGAGVSSLPLDVAETQEEFLIRASLPGIRPEDVHLTVHGDTVTIRGESRTEEERNGQHWHLRERRLGSFARSVSLGAPIDADKAQTSFEHGVLTLTLPKAESAKPKQIKIGNVGSSSQTRGSEGGRSSS
jgi:HSP20 family protein